MAVKRFIDVYPNKVYLWDKEKNNCNIEDVPANSRVNRYWWRCSKGHSFRNTPKRIGIAVKEGCMYCQGIVDVKPFKGISLQDVYSEAKDIWDYDRNPFFPSEISHLSKVSVWIRCYEGHIFKVKVCDLAYKDILCPYCNNEEVAREKYGRFYKPLKFLWDSKKNGIELEEFEGVQDEDKCWFKCEKGHSFYRTISVVKERLSQGRHYCQYCSGTKLMSGVNDIETVYPEVAKLFDNDKNNVKACDISFKESSLDLWFRCKEGHSFRKNLKVVKDGVLNGSEVCPYCNGKELLSGFNDLETVMPNVAKFFDIEKNGVEPKNVRASDSSDMWFLCKEGHSFVSKSRLVRIALDNSKGRSVGCPICKGYVVLPGYNDFESKHSDLLYLWDYDKNSILPSEITEKNNTTPVWLKCSNGHSYLTYINSLLRSKYECCPYCSHLISTGSEEVYNFLLDFGIYVQKERVLPSNKRVDLFIPSKNIAIEYNGVYWHSDLYKSKNYHKEKYDECKNLGVQLLYIYEDDWRDKTSIVKKMLLKKLGCLVERNVNARDCFIKDVYTDDAKEFLSTNHIQGFASGSKYIGLYENNILVALIVVRRDGSNLNIVRYATSCNVRGGFSKLVRYIERNLSYEYLYTFSDNGVSDGGLYKNTGFQEAYSLPPDYMYVINDIRVHKFNYRIDRFRKDKNLKYKEGLSERELADLNGLKRIYDAGKIKWIKKKPV